MAFASPPSTLWFAPSKESRANGRPVQALDLLQAPLNSSSLIGGFELRMMALRAVERIGLDCDEVGTKAMGMLQLYAGKGGWEPEARRRAQDGAAAVQNSIKR